LGDSKIGRATPSHCSGKRRPAGGHRRSPEAFAVKRAEPPPTKDARKRSRTANHARTPSGGARPDVREAWSYPVTWKGFAWGTRWGGGMGLDSERENGGRDHFMKSRDAHGFDSFIPGCASFFWAARPRSILRSWVMGFRARSFSIAPRKGTKMTIGILSV